MPKTHPANFRAAERLEQTTPVYLYIFEFGATPDLFHLCNASEDVTLTGLPASKGGDPQTFTSSQVKHTAVNQETEINAASIDVAVALNTAAFTDELRAFLLTAVPASLKVTVVRVNSSTLPAITWADDCFVVFKGVATVIGFEVAQIQITFQALILQMEGQIPRFYYQKTCQHPLGGTLCGVALDAVAFRIATTISAVSEVQKTIDITETTLDGNAIDEFTFQGGKLQVLDGGLNVIDTVAIVATGILGGGSGTRLYLLSWSSTLAAATDVKVFRGCQRTTADCATTFSNLANFGGFPYIPDFSPAVHGFRT
jgi:uncharacterized phage protein (TIGR02218 family)